MLLDDDSLVPVDVKYGQMPEDYQFIKFLSLNWKLGIFEAVL